MIVAIDPGKSGGCVVASVNMVRPIPFRSVEQMSAELEQYPLTHAFCEKVRGTATLTHACVFEFGRNLGQWEGILATLEVPVTYVEPRTWQFPLKIYERNYAKRKSALFKVAKRRFGKLGRVTKATCDAWLLLEWAFQNHPLGRAMDLARLTEELLSAAPHGG